jgi:phosphoglycolate phosphatase
MSAGPKQTLVLWDVDHTLIESGGVSKENYLLAFELLTGRAASVQPRTDGRTDVMIMVDLLALNGENPQDYSPQRQWDALVGAAERNRAALVERGHPMPGALACLQRLAHEPGVVQSVLTGNIEPNAMVKLGAFDLERWLDFSVGGFGFEAQERAGLVSVAQAKAHRRYGFDRLSDVTAVVGDTELDVHAGRRGGARVVAVATGVTPQEELRAAGADAVLPDLVDVEMFVDAVRAVCVLGPTGPRDQLGEAIG